MNLKKVFNSELTQSGETVFKRNRKWFDLRLQVKYLLLARAEVNRLVELCGGQSSKREVTIKNDHDLFEREKSRRGSLKFKTNIQS